MPIQQYDYHVIQAFVCQPRKTPTTYIHSGLPFHAKQHFQCHGDLSFFSLPTGKCRKGKIRRLITMPSDIFDFSLNGKRLNVSVPAVLPVRLSFLLLPKCADWRSRYEDLQSSVLQLCFSTASCCLPDKTVCPNCSLYCVLDASLSIEQKVHTYLEHPIKASSN